jgi:hypothetical protein
MKVVFSKNVWHRRLYNKYFDHRDSDNLCPYFWKVVLALCLSVILFPLELMVNLIMPLVYKIHNMRIARLQSKLNKLLENPNSEFEDMACIHYDIISLRGYVAERDDPNLKLIAEWYIKNVDDSLKLKLRDGGLYLENKKEEKYMSVYWMVSNANDRSRESWDSKSSYSNLLLSYIEAAYKKVCPKIDWIQ